MQRRLSQTRRAYLELKEQLLDGAIEPGPLDIQRLADKMRMSLTPVREALARLVGERLIEFAPRQGYNNVTLSPVQLRDLYEWSGKLALLALEGLVTPVMSRASSLRWRARSDTPQARYARAVSLLLHDIGQSQRNTELLDNICQMNDRLFVVRTGEPFVIPSAPEDLERLTSCWRSKTFTDLARTLAAYHRDRIKCAAEIAGAIPRRTSADT